MGSWCVCAVRFGQVLFTWISELSVGVLTGIPACLSANFCACVCVCSSKSSRSEGTLGPAEQSLDKHHCLCPENTKCSVDEILHPCPQSEISSLHSSEYSQVWTGPVVKSKHA